MPPVTMATTVRMTVFWIPHRVRVRTSLPVLSVPAQWSASGPWRMTV